MRKIGSVNLDLDSASVIEAINRNFFCLKFIKQVQKFLENFRLLPTSRKLLVGVSGGIDSMSLLFALHHLKKSKVISDLKVIYINHDTRKHNKLEEQFIQKIATSLALDFFAEKVVGLTLTMSNFEASARDKRYQVFQKYLDRFPDYFLALGHHLNDSYEWSFMQSKKSTTLKACLGIPVRNGKIIRPFLSVSKAQILNFAKHSRLPFYEDTSNADRRYERNFNRLELLPAIYKKYPKLIKNYVHQSNELAFALKKHRMQKFLPTASLILSYWDGMVLVYQDDLTKNLVGHATAIMQVIQRLSNKPRGSLRKEVEKLVDAFKNGKKGPMAFSGAVQCYMVGPFLLFTNNKMANWLTQKDSELAQLIKTKTFKCEYQSASQIVTKLQTKNRSLPFVALTTHSQKKDRPFKLNSILSVLFPKTTAELNATFPQAYFWILENGLILSRQNDTEKFIILNLI